MYAKRCNQCGAYTYSSAPDRIRKCARCDKDINDEEAIPAGKTDERRGCRV